jgi:hypothetical protein
VTPEEFNDKCIEQLRNAKLDGRIAVVGSGPSSPYIAPIKTLQQQLCDNCGISTIPNEEFWALAERAHSSSPDDYFRVIRTTYGDTPHWQARTYDHIARLPVQGWVTFNYDDQLPTACLAAPGPRIDFSVYPAIGRQPYASPQEFLGTKKRLIALHGYCNEKNPEWEKQIILRTTDYNAHYIDFPAPLFFWWREMLLTAPCIFLGTSLKEPGLHRAIEYLLLDHRDRLEKMNHIHLINNQRDPKTLNYSAPGRSLFVINQVHYDPIDANFSGLIRILSEFSGLPFHRPIPGGTGPEPIKPTDTFFYA